MRSVIQALPGRPARQLGVLHLVDALGNGMFVGGSALYLTIIGGLSPAEVGIGLSIAGIAGLVSTSVLGVVSDRLGARRTLGVVLLLAAVAYLGYPLVHSPWSFYPLAAVIGALEWGCGPSFISMIAEFVPAEHRIDARAGLRVLFNVGFGAGALAAAGLAAGHTRALLQAFPLFNAATFVAAGILVLRLPKVEVTPPAPGTARFKALRDLPFLRVVVVTTVLALQVSVLTVGVPLWLVSRTPLPHALAPALVAVNSVVIITLQLRMSRRVRTRAHAVTAGKRAGLAACAGCAALPFSTGMPVLVCLLVLLLGVALLTAAELWQVASAFSLGFLLAPEDRKGEYLGAFQMSTVAQSIIGPGLVAAVVGQGSGTAWLLVAALFLAGALTIGATVTRVSIPDTVGAPVAS